VISVSTDGSCDQGVRAPSLARVCLLAVPWCMVSIGMTDVDGYQVNEQPLAN